MGSADAIVFDFDGVLSNSEPLHERALLIAADTVGMSFDSTSFASRIVGLGDVAAFRVIAGDAGRELGEGELRELCRQKLRAFVDLVAESPPEPIAGAIELVRACAERVPVGVCTGSRRAEVDPLLKRFGIRDLLGTFVTADDTEFPKPDPAGYRLAAEILGGAHTVAIEDSPTGIVAAKGAGLRVIAVATSYPRERVQDADVIVERIADLDVDAVLGA